MDLRRTERRLSTLLLWTNTELTEACLIQVASLPESIAILEAGVARCSHRVVAGLLCTIIPLTQLGEGSLPFPFPNW